MKDHLDKANLKNFPANVHFHPPEKRPESYFILELKTRDTKPEHPIIELAIILVEGGIAQDAFHSLVRSGMKQMPRIAKTTGITDSMLEDAPTLFEVARYLGGFIGRRELPIFAHMAETSAQFIFHHGLAALIVPDCPLVSSRELAQRAFPKFSSYSLESFCRQLGFAESKQHRALNDAFSVMSIIESSYDALEGARAVQATESKRTVRCPSCNSTLLAKDGKDIHGNQRFRCKQCEHRFADVPEEFQKDRYKAMCNPTEKEAREASEDGCLHCPTCGSANLRKQELRGKSRRYLCVSCGKKTSFRIDSS